MSVLAFDEDAAAIARRLEDRERFRCGVSLPVARAAVARRLGVAPGAMERLRSGRTKGVRAWFATALRNALVAELEADIRRAEHELVLLRAARGCIAEAQAREVEEALAEARRVLRGDAGGEG